MQLKPCCLTNHQSIVLTNCKSFLVSSFITSAECLFSQSIPETHYLKSAACNLPYTHLREIVISLDGLEGLLYPHTPIALANIVEAQTSLEVLRLSKWPSQHCLSDPYDLESKGFHRLSSVMSKLYSRPQFCSLVLEHTDISKSDLYRLLGSSIQIWKWSSACYSIQLPFTISFKSELDLSNSCLPNTLPVQKKSLRFVTPISLLCCLRLCFHSVVSVSLLSISVIMVFRRLNSAWCAKSGSQRHMESGCRT